MNWYKGDGFLYLAFFAFQLKWWQSVYRKHRLPEKLVSAQLIKTDAHGAHCPLSLAVSQNHLKSSAFTSSLS